MKPLVEEHVATAAQAITIECILVAPVVPEFALGGVELAADLGVIEPDLTAGGEAAVEVDIVGHDPLPYGMAANRASIEALVTYSLQQKLIPSRPQLDQVFVEIDP